MKNRLLKTTLSSVIVALSIGAHAEMATKYELTITNGGGMPISPAVIYTKAGAGSAAAVGQEPTAGFIQLCQTGKTMARIDEIKADSTAQFAAQTTDLIFPGESKVIEIEVNNPFKQSLQFEAMYGKSKDVCAVAGINSHSLVALKQHVTSEVIEKDSVLQTGAFSIPVLPMGITSADPQFCADSTNAISCLRELSTMKLGKAQIRFFAGYLPGITNALEMKYGAEDVQSLQIPPSGAVQLKLKLKH